VSWGLLPGKRDPWWWRLLPAGGWLQLLARKEVRVESRHAAFGPVLSTSVDLLGDITIAISRDTWSKLKSQDRIDIVERHKGSVDKLIDGMASPKDAIERAIKSIRLAIWAVLIGPAGVMSSIGRVSWLVVLGIALTLGGLELKGLIQRGAGVLIRWYLTRLLRG
jgi:hypothetical protein